LLTQGRPADGPLPATHGTVLDGLGDALRVAAQPCVPARVAVIYMVVSDDKA
jgi:hypothetical protein